MKIDPKTGRLADPKCAAAKYWTREYWAKSGNVLKPLPHYEELFK